MPNQLQAYTIFLFIFICINVLIYFLIQLKARENLFKKLFHYWLAVLFVYIFESSFTEGKLALSLTFLSNFIPIAIMTNFLLGMYNTKLKTRFYLMAIPVSVVLTFCLDYFGAPFVVTSLPIVMVCSAPFVEGLYVSLVIHKDDREMTKIIACVLYCMGILSAFYYALNRYEASELQFLIGFGSAFVTYLMCSMLLPIVGVQLINVKKTQYLETLIEDRTRELNESNQEKERMLRVLVHDVSNPLQAAMFQVGRLKKVGSTQVVESGLLEKLNKSLSAIKDIIGHVREYEHVVAAGARAARLSDVSLQECLSEVEELFLERFSEKKVKLLIHNKLSPETTIRVNKIPFIHSVACNLISNALKFSMPGSEVLVLVSEKEANIVIEVIDRGIGMSKESLRNLFEIGSSISRKGTLGESGTGFGMPIVKAYVTMFGGRIEAQSSQADKESGTTISLYLPNHSSHNYQSYLQ